MKLVKLTANHLRLALLTLGLAASGCGGLASDLDVPITPAEADREGAEEDVPAEPVALPDPTDDEVQELLDARCVRCHSAGNVFPLVAPFRDQVVNVYTAGFGGCFQSEPVARVKPGSRERSYLWQKITGTQTCGSPMPYGPGGPLSPEEVELIGRWIDAL